MSEEEGMMFMMSVQGLSKKKQQNGISAGDNPIGLTLIRSDRASDRASDHPIRSDARSEGKFGKNSKSIGSCNPIGCVRRNFFVEP